MRQAAALEATLRACNRAAGHVSQVAFESGVKDRNGLQKLVYADIKATFGLSAQPAVRVVKKVVDAYSALAAGLKADSAARAAATPSGPTVCPARRFVDSCLADPQAQQMWRDLMTAIQYFWRHPLAEQVREEGREEGRAQERAESVLRNLQWRRIDVPDAVRERVLSSTDMDELGAWLERSYQVSDAWELFAEGA
ncbi:hypothetical protein [Streptomyces sp. 2A115]|uniref:hypothetical protein n=1 Tax=Streptomyces sp. 2A115 TaxID=3457439 RepID=UPI003FCF833D